MSLSIEELNLSSTAEKAARQLQKECPHVVFLSGRRTLQDQARAMASNVTHNRNYISETYALSVASSRCQQWVNHHPEAKTVEEIEAGLLTVLTHLTPDQQLSISRHLTGDAFDIAPHSATVAAIENLKPRKFLQKEAGLVRWHVEI